MLTYLTTCAALILLASALGRRLARRHASRAGKLSGRAAALIVGAAALWFFSAQLAREYADYSGARGSEAAAWFAHSGKWFVLLAAIAVGHSYIYAAGLLPPAPARRKFYQAAVLGITVLIGWRTLPVYVFLDAGCRDGAGLMRQDPNVESTCGAVALLNYLEQFRGMTNLTEREVSRRCGVTLEGSTPGGILRAARYYGLTNATARVLTWRELPYVPRPVIVSISTMPQVRHATLLVGLNETSAAFLDPAYGWWVISRERFRQIWYGPTLVLE